MHAKADQQRSEKHLVKLLAKESRPRSAVVVRLYGFLRVWQSILPIRAPSECQPQPHNAANAGCDIR